jgi:hypothetical protein
MQIRLRPLALLVGGLSLVAAPAFAQLDVPPEPPNLPPPPTANQPPPPSTNPAVPVPTATPAPTDPGAQPDPRNPYKSLIRAHKPSPTWTQDRNFTSTRFWLLDPGQYEVETWLRTRIQHDFGTGRDPAEMLFQNEIEIGVAPHLQIDLYENMTFNVDDTGNRSIQQEGVQIEARIAIPSYYGQIFGNPVLYLEWHPRHLDPDRAEIRLLLGGAITDRLFLAINPYIESNIEKTPVATGTEPKGAFLNSLGTSNKMLYDMEFGTTVAVGFKVNDWLRVSAELKIGWDMLGSSDNSLHFVAWLGPGLILKPLPGKLKQYLKIMATCLFDVVPRDAAIPTINGETVAPQAIEPLVIIGTQF